MEKESRYALSALKRKRVSLAAEIVQLEHQVRSRKDSLGHVDVCLRLLDPSFPVETIPNKRIDKHVTLFRQGKLSTAEIVTSVLAAGIDGEDARPALRMRVRGNLGYLERWGKVLKLGARAAARWRLRSS